MYSSVVDLIDTVMVRGDLSRQRAYRPIRGVLYGPHEHTLQIDPDGTDRVDYHAVFAKCPVINQLPLAMHPCIHIDLPQFENGRRLTSPILTSKPRQECGKNSKIRIVSEQVRQAGESHVLDHAFSKSGHRDILQ